jgi:hypothetical protein
LISPVPNGGGTGGVGLASAAFFVSGAAGLASGIGWFGGTSGKCKSSGSNNREKRKSSFFHECKKYRVSFFQKTPVQCKLYILKIL